MPMRRHGCVRQPCASSVAALMRRPLLAAAAALVWLQLQTVAAQPLIGLPNCSTSCGSVSVPYPFGMEPGCYLPGFNLTCNASYTPPRLFLWGDLNVTITEISSVNSTMVIINPEQQPGLFALLPSFPLNPIRALYVRGKKQQQLFQIQQPSSAGSIFFFDEHLEWKWKLVSSALQWPGETRAGNATCPRDLGTAVCHSSHSTCQAITTKGAGTNNVSGYVCRCDDGYQGNPYLSDGCQDLDECEDQKLCFGNCTNLPGTYLCECPKGTTGDPWARNGCVKTHHLDTGIIILLGVGGCEMLLILVLGIIFILRKIKTQRKKKIRQRFFKQNRGQLLQQLVCQRADIAERMIVTLEELEKATNNFDKAREIGRGGHGTVYKGILSTLHVVAIKKSKIVIQKEIYEFINEVAILSQINHRHIVKLIGCCLETEVPLLVYEFISNGTLYNHLHVQDLVSLPWRQRLRIAVETARALAYLHSLVSMPIIHRDVKSANILLDDNLTVKLSDFGASRYVPVDQNGLDTTVQGTFGYLDPLYHSTGHLTEKSDVYSFGVILIELLTRKKPASYRSPQGHSLVYYFVTMFSEGNLVHILDTQVDKEGGGEVVDIALLAKTCVQLTSKDRPTMREVEILLESIHAAKEDVLSDTTYESEESYVQMNDLSLKAPMFATTGPVLVAALLAVAAAGGDDQTRIGLPGCTTSCGGVSVPYPFGMEPGCSLGLSRFNLTCQFQAAAPPQLLLQLGDENFVVLDISLLDSTVRLHRLVAIDIYYPYPGIRFLGTHRVVEWDLASTAGPPAHGGAFAGNETCPRDLGSTACHSSHSTCRPSSPDPCFGHCNFSGYVCSCEDGYQGNAYLPDGCQDIDECSIPNKCFGICTNLPGKYLCQCPEGTIGEPYTPNGCVKPRHPNMGLIIGLGIGSGAMLLFLVLSIIFVIHRIMTQKKRLRQRFFNQNHGQLLQQLVCQRADISERMILTLEELEKATNNFDKAREVGGGGHGTVYKGILTSLHVVAIKKAKIVIQKEIDEFINEVVILSQINHRNIVKLHGCCLETEVPLLVYEFISNGTLYNHLHVEALVSLTWEDRVRIAVETARALAYLHSLTSMPIIHRDVKSPNILLDDNLTVKLSDFGASRYVPLDQTGLDTAVQGTSGYLDPMYNSTGHLTEKSDVYSFGVILIELLTRKKPVSYRSPEGYGLVNHFSILLSEHNLVHIIDPQVLREGGGEVVDISLLAAMCVKPVSNDRPTMRIVEMTLESIHAATEYASSNMTDESEENCTQVNGMHIGGPCMRELSSVVVAVVLMRPVLLAAALVWPQLSAVVVAAAAAAAADPPPIALPGCPDSCGNVSVPYPFGLQPRCFMEGFDFVVTCDHASPSPRLFLSSNPNLTVTDISYNDSTMRIFDLSPELESPPPQPSAGSVFYEERSQWKWKLVSSALPGPNETRPGNETCPPHDLRAVCHSSHSTCQATAHPYPGYVCKCDGGYQGNPYLSDPYGCQDVDECALLGTSKLCYGDCTNLIGTYLCECPEGTSGNPKVQNGCVKPSYDLDKGLIILAGVGGGGEMLLLLVLGIIFIVRKIKTRRKKKMRQRIFEQNRRQLLQQLVCQRADIAERMIVTLEELEKATNNFDKAREIGGGGHGTVYKGILSTLHIVAIKKSNIVIRREIDGFINEVGILSQVNHRNIVKLIGCCLETEVPLLVYEFISNGTLHSHLHVRTLVSLSWRHRLKIALETARALAYIHSLVSMPIIHRDVKSLNILLDDNLTVKLSDFGASRYVLGDQTGLDTTVQGTLGYLDPLYYSTGHLTEKSDVYSFGVILIELLTRKEPTSYRSPHGHSLVYYFVTMFSEGNLVHILDPQVGKEGGGEVVDIALLAKMCVQLTSKDRPTMREVEIVLESIQAAKEDATSDTTYESDESYIQVNDLSPKGTKAELLQIRTD
ncbi:hypothetical protein U9M48_005404 [Paspalum notatum var. saurae]|uniref:Uncharacterized protein n=1 Tax=Paspalum notatum var. saurae TaxID=547442 RepID=A0AAQ3PXI9_PASNO